VDAPAQLGPYDTPASAALRFAVELVAWIAGPMAVAHLADSGWAAIPTLAVLVAVPAVFSTPGDKKQVIVPVSGLTRAIIEWGLHAVAALGAYIAWPTLLAVATVLLVCVSLVIGTARTLWLLGGAEPVDG
jgi:hypothetical protein